MSGVPLRVRHGVIYDAELGLYRAIREWNGLRSYLGPWCVTEAAAQANADEATRITHEVLNTRGIDKTKGDTPLGIWAPSERGS